MPAILLYLLKVNVALVLFYLAYHLVLRRLTFYHLNRLFLVFSIVFSTVYPLIDLSEIFAEHQPIAQAYVVTIPAWALTTQTITQTPGFDYWQLPVYLFWAGVIVMLLRFIVQFASLYKIHATSEPANYKNIGFRKVKSINQAFSFWQTIYLNPAQHKTEELESILRHELIHITGWHTLDVLLAELSTVFYWFNPGAWLMKKAVKENLEFIADQNVVNTGVDKREYQYLLLKVVGATQPQIANQFNFPSLKRRIAMMNKMPSTKKHLLKFLAIVPAAAVFLLAFNMVAPLRANNIDLDELKTYTRVGPDIYIKTAPTFKTACWFAPNTLSITNIAGEEESYQLDNEEDLAEVNSKYGLYLPDHEKYNKISVDALKKIKQDSPDSEVSYETFYARNPEVSEVAWLSGGKIMVKLKSGVNQVFQYGNKKDIAIAEMTYGKLPSTPPIVIRDQNPQTSGKKSIDELINQLKQNPAVKSVRSKVVDKKSAIAISLKGGGTEVYYLNDAASIAELKRKYSLQELPPPPPPAPDAPDAPPVAEDSAPFIFSVEDEPYYRNNLPADYKAFLDRNPNVKKLGWKFEDRIDYNLKSIVIYLKNGKVETYDFNRNPRIPAVEAKYGRLPNLPAPPPPVRTKDQPTPAPITPEASPTRGIRDSFNLNQTPGPTYYIDAVEASSEALSKLDVKQIHSINVHKGEAAKEVLGDKAYYGVISIVTEGNKNSKKVMEFNQKFPASQTPQSPKKHIITTEESTNNPATNAKSFSFVLTANNASEKLFNVGKEHFKQNGFNVEFKGVYDGDKLIGVNVNSRHRDKYEGTSSYYSIADLKERNYAIIVTANKETGQVTNKAVKRP